MYAGGSRLDHGLHQLERVQVSAKTRFRVGDERCEPVRVIVPLRMMNLVRACQGLINASHYVGNTIGGIETLVGIHLARVVGIGRDLPAADVNRRQSGSHLLDRLVARHRAQRRNVRLGVQEAPQPFRAQPRQGVLEVD